MPERRMTAEAITAVLGRAMREGHAATLSLDHHRPILIEPRELTHWDGKTVLVYWNVENKRIEKHMVGLITEALDLERSLDDLRPDQVGRPQRRRVGRPRKRTEAERVVYVRLSASVADALDATTDNKTAYIEQMLRERLMRPDDAARDV